MININSQLFNKTMTKVIEYMKKLEVLEVTSKQQSNQETRNVTREVQKIRLESLKARQRNFTIKIPSAKTRREREVSLTLTLMTSTISTAPYAISYVLVILQPSPLGPPT